MPIRPAVVAILVAGGLSLVPVRSAGQDGEETGWSFEGELSTVLTEGNSTALTLGVGASLTRVGERSEWEIEMASVRTESGTVMRTAVGTEDEFDVVTDTERAVTAENYALKTRYDLDLSETTFAYGAADWLRNTFTGIESRVVLSAGVGRTWWENDDSRLKTAVGAAYTFENDVVRSGARGQFPGLRGRYEYAQQVTASSEMESSLVADLNLDDTRDLRLDWVNSLAVSINAALALKPSLQLLWRNRPSLTEVPLFSPTGEDTGETVLTPLEKLDTQFRLALVVSL